MTVRKFTSYMLSPPAIDNADAGLRLRICQYQMSVGIVVSPADHAIGRASSAIANQSGVFNFPVGLRNRYRTAPEVPGTLDMLL